MKGVGLLAILACVMGTAQAAAQSACEIARQVVAADNDEYGRLFNEGKASARGLNSDQDICAAKLSGNLHDDVAALEKEMRDAQALKAACPGVERAQTGADKLIALLQPKLESARAARDAVDKTCPLK